MPEAFMLIPLAFALGFRHGAEPDHVAAVDALTRLHPSPWTGALFAIGHGAIVTVLAFVVNVSAKALEGAAPMLEALAPWILVGLAALTILRLLRRDDPSAPSHWGRPVGGALVTGALLGLGAETASQISALALAAHVAPLAVGLAFTLGLVVLTGVDGVFAARLASAQDNRVRMVSRRFGWAVAVITLTLAALQFSRMELPYAEAWGAALIFTVIALRWWTFARLAPT